jgi:hypothetical protein
MTVATGAWAQEQSETIATTANVVEGTHFTISSNDAYVNAQGMNADEGITVTAKNGETITKVFIICTVGYSNVHDYNTTVSSGTKEVTDAGVINVTGVNASTFTFTCSDTSAQFSQFVVYYTEAPASYSVTMPQDTPDASNWTGKAGTATTFSALPLENVAQGDAVTLKYSGDRRVKTVTATLLQMQSLTVAKGSTELSGDKVLYYLPGDTYRQALARTENQSTGGLGWGYWEDSSLTTIYFKEVSTKAWDVAIDGDSNFGSGKGSCTITLDTEINPTGHTFQFVGSK